MSAKTLDRGLEATIKRCLTDTGFLARNVLGNDYDKSQKDGKKINVGTGGVRNSGPHAQMVAFVDGSGSNFKLMLCSRGTYKTTLLQARAIRAILLDPNSRILFGRHTYSSALEALDAIRDQLEHNEELVAMFGRQQGPKWRREAFTVATRNQRGIREPSFSAFGTDKPVTGGHYDLIIWDDPITNLDAKSLPMLQKSRTILTELFPVLDPGGVMIVDMTPRDEEDISFYIKRELKQQFEILELDCGMWVTLDGEGRETLEGEPRFPHLTRERLYRELYAMKSPDFQTQYALRTTNPKDQCFYRDQFGLADWSAARFERMSSYILVDTAVKDDQTGCFTAVALVALDWDDTAYLLDLSIGHWLPSRVKGEIIGMLERWHPRTRVCGVTMENVTMNHVYGSMLQDEARLRGLPWRPIGIPRGSNDGSKNMRIRGLEDRFKSGKFKVVSQARTGSAIGVPVRYHDLGKGHTLFDPEGWKDHKTGAVLPAGELVDQFVRFRYSGSAGDKDIPDALADLEAVDARGRRFVQPSPKTQHESQDDDSSRKVSGRDRGPRRVLKSDFWSRMSQRARGA